MMGLTAIGWVALELEALTELLEPDKLDVKPTAFLALPPETVVPETLMASWARVREAESEGLMGSGQEGCTG